MLCGCPGWGRKNVSRSAVAEAATGSSNRQECYSAMTENGTQPAAVAPLARRTNGLSPLAPDPGRLILVTGGAGLHRLCPHPASTQPRLPRADPRSALLGPRPDRADPRPGRARRGGRPRHAGNRARRRRRGDPSGGSVQRPHRRVRPGGQLADERGRHRDAGPQLRRPRGRASRIRLVLLAV